MSDGWRLYCRKCDKFGEGLRVGDPLPAIVKCKACGSYPELVQGMWIVRQYGAADAILQRRLWTKSSN